MSFPWSFPEGCEKSGGKELPCWLWPETGRVPALKWFCDRGGSSEVSGVSFIGTALEKKVRFAGGSQNLQTTGAPSVPMIDVSRFPLQTFIFRGLWVCSKNPLRVYTWFTPGLCLPKFILTAFLCGSSSWGWSWTEPDVRWFPMLLLPSGWFCGRWDEVGHNYKHWLPTQLMFGVSQCDFRTLLLDREESFIKCRDAIAQWMCLHDTSSGTCYALPCSPPVLCVLRWPPLTCEVMHFGSCLLFKFRLQCGDGLTEDRSAMPLTGFVISDPAPLCYINIHTWTLLRCWS